MLLLFIMEALMFMRVLSLLEAPQPNEVHVPLEVQLFHVVLKFLVVLLFNKALKFLEVLQPNEVLKLLKALVFLKALKSEEVMVMQWRAAVAVHHLDLIVLEIPLSPMRMHPVEAVMILPDMAAPCSSVVLLGGKGDQDGQEVLEVVGPEKCHLGLQPSCLSRSPSARLTCHV